MNQPDATKEQTYFVRSDIEMVKPGLPVDVVAAFCMPPHPQKNYGVLHRPFSQHGLLYATDSNICIQISGVDDVIDRSWPVLARPLSHMFSNTWAPHPTTFGPWPAPSCQRLGEFARADSDALVQAVDSRLIAASYHHKIAQLPQIEFAQRPGPPGSDNTVVLFRFEGGRGLVMPIALS